MTDLALALSVVRGRWGSVPVRCTCLSGGKPDHALAVLGRLAAWEGGVELVEEGMCGRVLRAGERWAVGEGSLISLAGGGSVVGARFSFVPVSPEAVVSERGMRWGLERERVPLLSDLGISNVVERGDASVACHGGAIACWLFPAR